MSRAEPWLAALRVHAFTVLYAIGWLFIFGGYAVDKPSLTETAIVWFALAMLAHRLDTNDQAERDRVFARNHRQGDARR